MKKFFLALLSLSLLSSALPVLGQEVRVTLIGLKTTPEIALKYGLGGLPLARDPKLYSAPIFPQMRRTDALALIAKLKSESGTEVFLSSTVLGMSGESLISRTVTQTSIKAPKAEEKAQPAPPPSPKKETAKDSGSKPEEKKDEAKDAPKPKEETTPAPDNEMIEHGSRIEITPTYHESGDLISLHLSLQSKFALPDPKMQSTLNFDLYTDVCIESGDAIVFHAIQSPSKPEYDKGLILFVFADKNKFVFADKNKEERKAPPDTQSEPYEPETMIEVSSALVQVSKSAALKFGLDGSAAPDSKVKLGVQLSTQESIALFDEIRKLEGFKVINSFSSTGINGQESTLRLMDCTPFMDSDGTLMGICSRVSPNFGTGYGVPLITFKFNPVFHVGFAKNKLAAKSYDSSIALKPGNFIFQSEINDSEHCLISIIGAKNFKP